MVEVKVEIDVECECGNPLLTTTGQFGTGLVVEICEKCLENEYEKGKIDGYNEAEKDLKEEK